MPPWRQISTAPRSHASRARRTISVERHEVGRPAEVRGEPAFRERAEAAAEVADVRVVHVPRDDVGDRVAGRLTTQVVGRGEDRAQVVTARLEERGDVVLVEAVRPPDPSASALWTDSTTTFGALPFATRVDFGDSARPRVGGGYGTREIRRAAGLHRARGPGVLAGEPGRVRPRRRIAVATRGAVQRSELRDRLRVHREPRRERQPSGLRGLTQPLDLGPRRLGVHVVERHRRDPAPVVDPRVQEARELVVREIRRHLDVHRRAEDDPRGGGRPEELVERRLGMGRHLRAGLRAEVLDDHLLDVSVPFVQRADCVERVEPLLARLADPDQDPGRERHREPPARSIVARRAAGFLSGEPKCGPPRLESRSEVVSSMRPCERRPRGAAHDFLAVMTPGFTCGRRPVSVEDEVAHVREELDRRRAAERRELFARGPVAKLGLVAQGEERLVAARRGAGARDREHLVLRQVRPLPRRGGRAKVQ